MKEMVLITSISIKNSFRMKAIIAVLIAVTLICVIGLTAGFCLLAISPEVNKETPNRQLLEMYVSVTIYGVSLIGAGVTMNVIPFQTMTREKARGNIAALLATPLDPVHIWIGKSFGAFLPGLLLGIIFALTSLLVINIIYFIPNTGFLISPGIIINGFITAPLIYLSLSFLVHFVSLTGKPATGNAIAQVFLPVFASLMINLGLRNILDASSWKFTAANLGLALIIGVIVLLLRPRLTTERIVLS